ncbi:MAG: hypothetical protein ACI4PC_00630 [Oscillospiraceae bacterium]
MNPQVEKFLEDAEKEKSHLEEEKQQQRVNEVAEKLMRKGYYEKEYAPEGADSGDYPRWEKAADGSTRRYKRVPIRLTDEEYERVKGYFPDVVSESDLSSVMKVAAILELVVGVIVCLLAKSLLLILLPLAVAVPTWAIGELSKRVSRIEERLREKEKDK